MGLTLKYKNLKSVAHNLGHSFTSDMNWATTDYAMNHLARAAIASGVHDFWIDLLSGECGPQALVSSEVRACVAARHEVLERLLRTQSADPDKVTGGRLQLHLDVARRSAHPTAPGVWEFPFECVVELTDDRGKVHRGEVRDWWYGYTRTPSG